MGAKANLGELNELHGVIAKYYIEAVESGEELFSGTLAAINAFLKNNDITVDIIEDSPAQSLSNKLQLLIYDNSKEVSEVPKIMMKEESI